MNEHAYKTDDLIDFSAINGVQTTLSGKQDKLTFDSTPTSGSNNPVTSGGIFTAINAKQDKITGGATSIISNNLGANYALISDTSGKVATSVVTATSLSYLSNVTSDIQTQLNDLDTKIVEIENLPPGYRFELTITHKTTPKDIGFRNWNNGPGMHCYVSPPTLSESSYSNVIDTGTALPLNVSTKGGKISSFDGISYNYYNTRTTGGNSADKLVTYFSDIFSIKSNYASPMYIKLAIDWVCFDVQYGWYLKSNGTTTYIKANPNDDGSWSISQDTNHSSSEFTVYCYSNGYTFRAYPVVRVTKISTTSTA